MTPLHLLRSSDDTITHVTIIHRWHLTCLGDDTMIHVTMIHVTVIRLAVIHIAAFKVMTLDPYSRDHD